MALDTTRRGLITGLIAFAAAPAIVRAASLMPVKVMKPALFKAGEYVTLTEFNLQGGDYYRCDRMIWMLDGHFYEVNPDGSIGHFAPNHSW